MIESMRTMRGLVFAAMLSAVGAAESADPLTPTRRVEMSSGPVAAEAGRERIVLANGVVLELLTEGDAFHGLGRITIDDVVVRGGRTPLSAHVIEQKVYPRQLIGVDAPPMHEQAVLDRVILDDDGLGARIVTRLKMWRRLDDQLTWLIRAHEETWRGTRSVGFSYAFRFESAGRKVHQIREEGTWGIDGSVRGVLLIDQNESYGRQSWAMVAADDTAIAPWSFPPGRQTPEGRLSVGDMVDFISVANASIVRYLDRPALTFKELSLTSSDDSLRAREWYPTAATTRFETTPMHVRLLHAGGVNAWIDARDHVREQYVEQSGIKPTPHLPGIIAGEAAMTTAAFGEKYEAMADPREYVDWLKSQGMRRTWTWCRWKTAWTMWDRLTPQEQAEVEVGLSHAVMELTWDDAVIDLPRFKRFVELSSEAGVDSMLWVPGGHLSAVSPLYKRYPEWIRRDWSGNQFKYVFTDIGGNFYPAGYGRYMIDAIKRAREEIPFTGIWLDSFQVFGLDVIDYGREGWPHQFDAAAQFVKEARQNDLNVATETNFPLAVRSSTGIYKVAEIDGLEFLAYRTSQHFGGKSDAVTPERYFRLVAWMGPPLLRDQYWKQTPGFSELGAYVNHVYNALVDQMDYPRRLDDGLGVLWCNDQNEPVAVFAFRDGELDGTLAASHVVEASSGESAPIQHGKVQIKANHVYRLR